MLKLLFSILLKFQRTQSVLVFAYELIKLFAYNEFIFFNNDNDEHLVFS